MPNNKRLWLIDAGYMVKAQRKSDPHYSFDYWKLRTKIEQDGAIWRAYYLNCTSNPPKDEQDGFHRWLRTAPPSGPKIITKLYKLKRTSVRNSYCDTCDKIVDVKCRQHQESGLHRLFKNEQKGVDVGIATLALTLANEYDTLILSSGDSDLLDAIQHVTDHGKRFELVVFRYGVSSDLQCRADNIYWIDDFKSDVAKEHVADIQPDQ